MKEAQGNLESLNKTIRKYVSCLSVRTTHKHCYIIIHPSSVFLSLLPSFLYSFFAWKASHLLFQIKISFLDWIERYVLWILTKYVTFFTQAHLIKTILAVFLLYILSHHSLFNIQSLESHSRSTELSSIVASALTFLWRVDALDRTFFFKILSSFDS